MLVYLATYPRSGNSLLQRVITRNFGWLPTQIKAALPNDLERWNTVKGWEIRPAPTALPEWPEPALWNESTQICRHPGGPWQRRLRFVTQAFLTEDVRRQLASERNPFFVKTHHLPFEQRFEGERVIQIIRHPGPALLSYWRLLRQRAGDAESDNAPVTLDQVIRGDVQFGSWADYHAAWDEAARRLGSGFLRLDFTDLAGDQDSARTRLSGFLGLKIISDAPVRFEGYRAAHPTQELRGEDAGYELFYSPLQLQDLWRRHGVLAQRYGYPEPRWAEVGLALERP